MTVLPRKRVLLIEASRYGRVVVSEHRTRIGAWFARRRAHRILGYFRSAPGIHNVNPSRFDITKAA